MERLFDKIKGLYIILKIFWWISLKALVLSFIQLKNGSRLRTNWCKQVCLLLQLKMKKMKSKYQIRKEKTIFIVNHRSQADFFIHGLILGNDTNFLSRREVAIMFGIPSLFALKTVWFFNRSNVNIQKFNQWLDKKYEQAPQKGLIIYPQGHRMYDTKTVSKQKIKRGMIKYAYSRKIPVQILISFGNELAFNERKLKISYGQEIYYKVGKVIDPKDFENEKDFIQAATTQFIKTFDQTFVQYKNKIQTIDTTNQLMQTLEFKRE